MKRSWLVALVGCRSGLLFVLVACAHPAPSNQSADDAYPKAYAGPPANPLESALAFVHRTALRAREHHESIQLACLRDKEEKLDALRIDRERLPPSEVDSKARQLLSDAERCIGGN